MQNTIFEKKSHAHPARLRNSAGLRRLVQETQLQKHNLVLPLFIAEGAGIFNHIKGLPNHYQFSIDKLDKELEQIARLGISSVLLFGIPLVKVENGESSDFLEKAISYIKKQLPDLVVITDVCLCSYTLNGHCGVFKNGRIDHATSSKILSAKALKYAIAGADIVAPSAMMDGMVSAIRTALDTHHMEHTAIMSYSAKYASNMYGPFRAAANGAPQFGDRKTYQMDFCNAYEAEKEVRLDIEEGADIVMVKPAHTYLDIISRIKTRFPDVPLAAYHTSGEYAMIKAAAQAGTLDEEKAMYEITTAIKRAGADIIISYYTKELVALI